MVLGLGWPALCFFVLGILLAYRQWVYLSRQSELCAIGWCDNWYVLHIDGSKIQVGFNGELLLGAQLLCVALQESAQPRRSWPLIVDRSVMSRGDFHLLRRMMKQQY